MVAVQARRLGTRVAGYRGGPSTPDFFVYFCCHTSVFHRCCCCPLSCLQVVLEALRKQHPVG